MSAMFGLLVFVAVGVGLGVRIAVVERAITRRGKGRWLR